MFRQKIVLFSPGELLLDFTLCLSPLVRGHPPGLPQHLQPKQEHDGRARVVGVLPRHELGHHKAQQGRHDRHDGQGRNGGQEDSQLVVAHGENGGDEEGLVAELGDEDDGERLNEAVQEAFVLRGVELQLEVVVVVVDHGGGAVEDEIRIRG